MTTPYFLISEKKLNDNLDEFKSALKKYWPNSEIAYSIKTNSLPWLLKYLNQQNVLAEAVSDEEYQLAKLCGYADDKIIFNGPIKGDQQFVEAINGGAIINLDSVHDIELMAANKIKKSDTLGIRVNLETSMFDSQDIGYEEDGFRFGFSDAAGMLETVIDKIREIYGDCRLGLHLHCNSVTRAVDVYRALAQYAVTIIQKYHLRVSYIDIGGGFFGGVKGKASADDYISTIKNVFVKAIDISETKLIIEPGSAIIGSVIDLYTSVLDVKDTAYSRIVTTDGSRIHIDPLWKKSRYMYSLLCEKEEIFSKKQIICGYTCMDHDRIMEINNEPELSIGDKIVYHRVGAYSVTFGGPFIRYFPDVYIEHSTNKETELVRKRIGVDDYYKIQSI